MCGGGRRCGHKHAKLKKRMNDDDRLEFEKLKDRVETLEAEARLTNWAAAIAFFLTVGPLAAKFVRFVQKM